MADEKARKQAEAAAAKAEQARFDEWVDVQEEAGFSVEGDTFATARVVELPDGPTIDANPGG